MKFNLTLLITARGLLVNGHISLKPYPTVGLCGTKEYNDGTSFKAVLEINFFCRQKV